MSDRLVIVGADAAGMSAAMQVRRRQPKREVVVLEKGDFTSYSACGIPYVVGGVVDDIDDLVARSPEKFRDAHDIDVRLGHEARALDLDAGVVEAWDRREGREVRVEYDKLHLATGATPVRPALPGLDRPIVHGVQNLDDAARCSRPRSATEDGPRRSWWSAAATSGSRWPRRSCSAAPRSRWSRGRRR